MNESIADLRGRYRCAHTALHVLWTRAVGTPDYNKSDWKFLQQEIDQVFRDALDALGYKGPLLP